MDPSLARAPAPGAPAPAAPEAAAFTVRNLGVWYGQRQALKDVSIDIPHHRITAFIGPSGCGKSTLLRALNRMNDLIPGARTEGTVHLGTQDVYAPDVEPAMLRRHVGMVFQKPNPFPKSVYENVAYGIRLHEDLDKATLGERVRKALAQAQILEEVEDRLDQPGTSLSGGQQQRLCIARALAVQPSVILLDEPTSALDPIATAKIEDLLEDLKKEVTVVIVTHNMQQAARISDHTAYLYLGELVETGPSEQIFENPRDERTEAYITGRFG